MRGDDPRQAAARPELERSVFPACAMIPCASTRPARGGRLCRAEPRPARSASCSPAAASPTSPTKPPDARCNTIATATSSPAGAGRSSRDLDAYLEMWQAGKAAAGDIDWHEALAQMRRIYPDKLKDGVLDNSGLWPDDVVHISRKVRDHIFTGHGSDAKNQRKAASRIIERGADKADRQGNRLRSRFQTRHVPRRIPAAEEKRIRGRDRGSFATASACPSSLPSASATPPC